MVEAMADPDTISDRELLKRFSATRSDAAFAELVERHIGMVHAVATRSARNAADARDIAQNVFNRLARIQGRIPASVPLPVWLYRQTCSTAASHMRGEKRRREREGIAAELQAMNERTSLDELGPEIDSMINALPSKSRAALVLRFFKGDSHASIGAELGVSEEAARKRVARSLETLRRRLMKRGITTTAALLSSTLATHATGSAPAKLAAAISTSALVNPPAAAGSVSAILKALTMTTSTKTVVVAAAAVLVTALTTYLVTSQSYEAKLRAAGAPANAGEPASIARVPLAGSASSVEALRAKLPAWPSRRAGASAWQEVEKLSFDELEALLLEILSDDSAGQRDRELSGIFFEQMLYLDPEAAVALYEGIDRSQREAFPFTTYIRTLSTIDVELAKEVVSNLEPRRRAWGFQVLLGGLSADDPVGAMDYLDTLAPADLAGALRNLEALEPSPVVLLVPQGLSCTLVLGVELDHALVHALRRFALGLLLVTCGELEQRRDILTRAPDRVGDLVQRNERSHAAREVRRCRGKRSDGEKTENGSRDHDERAAGEVRIEQGEGVTDPARPSRGS